jgi:hypothetical protein
MQDYIPARIVSRFLSRLVTGGTDGTCLEWTRYRHPSGYGQTFYNRKKISAHRLAWMIAHGPIPDEVLVCHRCDNPPCCNPSHLFLGDYKDNSQDMVAKGRHAGQRVTHCRRGHQYSPENTRHIRGKRMCKTCERINSITWFRKHKSKGLYRWSTRS